MKKNLPSFTPLESRILLYILDGRAPRYVMEKLALNHNSLGVHLSHCRSKIRAGCRNGQNPNETPPPTPLPITPAQRRVLEMRAEGHSHPHIANTLGVSVNTSYLHASAGMRRLGVDCRNGFQLEPLQRALARLNGGKSE